MNRPRGFLRFKIEKGSPIKIVPRGKDRGISAQKPYLIHKVNRMVCKICPKIRRSQVFDLI